MLMEQNWSLMEKKQQENDNHEKSDNLSAFKLTK